jgi:hypothetical protein
MEFNIKNLQISISDLSRRIGYIIIDSAGNGKYNLVRKLHLDNYPRFHLYLTQHGDNYNFSLHLDQKKPIYESQNVHAHNGEYFGPVIDEEADRIKEILK